MIKPKKFLTLIVPAMLLLAIVSWCVGGFYIYKRVLTFGIKQATAVSVWSLDWQPLQGGVRNGYWLDRPAGEKSEIINFWYRLPNYPLTDLTIKHLGQQPEPMTYVNPRLTVYVLLLPISSQALDVKKAVTRDSSGDPVVFTGELNLTLVQKLKSILLLFFIYVVAAAGALILALSRNRLQKWIWQFSTPARWALLGVIAIQFWMLSWAPLIFSEDSVEYANNGIIFLKTHSLSHFNAWRMPGFSIFCAALLGLFKNFPFALSAVQALLGIAIGLMAFGLARRILPRPWPALILLLAGANPIMLTYEHYVLTEHLAMFMLTLLIYCLILGSARLRLPGITLRSLALVLLLGLLIGAMIYVRSNFQILVALIPFFYFVLQIRRRRFLALVVESLLILTISGGLIFPWMLRNKQKFGSMQISIGKEFTTFISLYNNRVLDLNETAVFPYIHFSKLRPAFLGDFGALHELMVSTKNRAPAAVTGPMATEWRCQIPIHESIARSPLAAIRGIGISFCSQLGLWTKFDHPTANENMYWSKGFRGLAFRVFNYPDQMRTLKEFAGIEARADVRPIEYLVDKPYCAWFNEMFLSYRLIRPAMALLFILGLLVSLRRGEFAVSVCALILLANVVLVAFMLMSAIDRYSVPYEPVFIIVSIYGLHHARFWWLVKNQKADRAESSANCQAIGVK